MKRRGFIFLAVASLILFVATLALWLWSINRVEIPIAAVTGQAAGLPAWYIPLPLPSDAAELLAINAGQIERWEYTSWDWRWYKLSGGISLLLPASLFAFISAQMLFLSRRRSGA